MYSRRGGVPDKPHEFDVQYGTLSNVDGVSAPPHYVYFSDEAGCVDVCDISSAGIYRVGNLYGVGPDGSFTKIYTFLKLFTDKTCRMCCVVGKVLGSIFRAVV